MQLQHASNAWTWVVRSSSPLIRTCGAVVGAFVAVAAGCSSPHHPPTGVVFVGDSLAEQAAPYLLPLLPGVRVVPRFFGGTAPCDWLGTDLQITAGSVVVISFTGNSASPCMSAKDGGHLTGTAVVEKYRADVTVLIAEALAAHARVLLVGQPVNAGVGPGNDVVAGLDRLYSDLASRADVAFVDAGAAVENPDGTWAHSLPCRPGEAECGPSGTNVVRSDDGLHFCPGARPPGPCPVYSSGAFRFASAIAKAIAAS